MRLGVLPSQLQPGELYEYSRTDVRRILTLPGIPFGHDSQFDHLRVSYVVECEQVRPRLFQGTLELTQSSRRDSWQKLS